MEARGTGVLDFLERVFPHRGERTVAAPPAVQRGGAGASG